MKFLSLLLRSLAWVSLESSLNHHVIPPTRRPVTVYSYRRRSLILMHDFRQSPVSDFLRSVCGATHEWPISFSSRTLTANIRTRRGSKVAINLPLFIDERTPRPFVDPTIPWQRNIYPEDPGMQCGPVSFTLLLLMKGRTSRGKKWRCTE